MTTYIFKVVVEPDEDKWSAYCPALLQQGAATWGNTEAEALQHIHECAFNHNVAKTAMIWLNVSTAMIWLKTRKRVNLSISMG